MKKSTIDKLKKGYSSSRSIPVKTTQTSRAKPHQYYDQDSVATTKARLRREEEAFQKAEQKYKQLCAAVVVAKEAEKDAIQKLWSAKYDTMTTKQLQAALAEAEDKDEKAYIQKVQSNRVAEQRKKDLKTMNSIGDPESVLYDPDFLEKSDYRSTKLPEGEWGESDTGYADIDYEFINNNPEISELIVGKERNYYQITEQERRVYNYWHHYDREHGTNVAENYLNLLQETLNDRDSALDYSKFEGNALIELLYGFLSGLSKYGNDVNRQYLQPLVDAAIRQRGLYANDPTARAIYERYLPRR